MKIIDNIWDKILDFIYIMIFQYGIVSFSISLFFLYGDGNQQKCVKIQEGFNHPNPHHLGRQKKN